MLEPQANVVGIEEHLSPCLPPWDPVSLGWQIQCRDTLIHDLDDLENTSLQYYYNGKNDISYLIIIYSRIHICFISLFLISYLFYSQYEMPLMEVIIMIQNKERDEKIKYLFRKLPNLLLTPLSKSNFGKFWQILANFAKFLKKRVFYPFPSIQYNINKYICRINV